VAVVQEDGSIFYTGLQEARAEWKRRKESGGPSSEENGLFDAFAKVSDADATDQKERSS
jgi:hypothetical protein